MCILQPLPRTLRANLGAFSPLRHLGLLTFLRLYTVGRLYRNLSPVYQRRHHAQMTQSVPARRVTTFLALRAALKDSPVSLVLSLLLSSLLVFTYCIFVIERGARLKGVDSTIFTPARAAWFVVATLTTVGYVSGDCTGATCCGCCF